MSGRRGEDGVVPSADRRCRDGGCGFVESRFAGLVHRGMSSGAWRPVWVVEVAVTERESLVISVEEAGVLLGISRGLAYELVRQGVIPSLRLGRRLVVPRRRLLELVDGERTEVAG
jgi:excisionase family DNA binding protein